MPSNYSDLTERLPLFETHMSHVRDAEADGAFHDVNPEVIRLMEGTIPVGLDDNMCIQLPGSYNPLDGPPVLMVHPNEYPSLGWSGGLQKGVSAVFDQIFAVEPQVDPTTHDRDTVGMKPAVSSITFNMKQIGVCEYAAAAPLYMSLPANLNSPYIAASAYAHELDHWDFLIRKAIGLYGVNGPEYKTDMLHTVLERHGYTASYLVEQNLGLHEDMPSIEELATESQYKDPGNASLDVKYSFRIHSNLSLTGGELCHSLPALTLSKLFGPDDPMRTTLQEAEAYIAAGYVLKEKT